MWTHKKSGQVIGDPKKFIPPYCPNPDCSWHAIEAGTQERKFRRHGSRPIRSFPYVSPRFRCRQCKTLFVASFFSLSYRDRTAATYEQIYDLSHNGYSKREIASFLDCSLDTVLRRHQKMAQQGLLIQAQKTKEVVIQESVAYDGLENFSYSQYDPNNINHVAGRDSKFTYDFNFSPLNRKGRMSPWQQKRKKELECNFGAYPSRAIEESTRKILLRLLERSPGELLFHSDNHYAYRRALKSLPGQPSITHLITPAKVARNFRNRLFAINHLDLLTRHHLAAFKRETIAFSKHSIAMIETFALFMVRKNFMRPVFTKKQVNDPRANQESPAMRIGIEKKILLFHEFFKVRLLPTQVKLNEDWAQFVERREPTSRRTIAA